MMPIIIKSNYSGMEPLQRFDSAFQAKHAFVDQKSLQQQSIRNLRKGRLSITIRKALKSDLEAILALYADLEIGDDQPLDLNDAERIFERMKRYPNYAIYVAELEDTVAGAFALLIMDNLAHGGAPSGIVEDVVVHSQWRGHGIGKAMMQFAMERCCQAGCYKLALSSNIKRQSAHEFYKSLGFEQHGYSFLVNL